MVSLIEPMEQNESKCISFWSKTEEARELTCWKARLKLCSKIDRENEISSQSDFETISTKWKRTDVNKRCKTRNGSRSPGISKIRTESDGRPQVLRTKPHKVWVHGTAIVHCDKPPRIRHEGCKTEK